MKLLHEKLALLTKKNFRGMIAGEIENFCLKNKASPSLKLFSSNAYIKTNKQKKNKKNVYLRSFMHRWILWKHTTSPPGGL